MRIARPESLRIFGEERVWPQVIIEHPPVLSYSPEERLQPLVDYLRSLGITDPAQVVRQRPTILGLNLEQHRRIVEYLQENEYTLEQIGEFLCLSI